MTWTTVALNRSLLKSGNFDMREHFAGSKISDFEAEQFIDVYINACLFSVDRKRPNELPNGPISLVNLCVCTSFTRRIGDLSPAR